MKQRFRKGRTGKNVVARKRRRKRSSGRFVQLAREDLRQLVLDLTAKPEGKSFGYLARTWLIRICKRRVCPENEQRHVRHMSPLNELREGDLTKAAIDNVFGDLLKPRGTLGAASVNKVRSTGRLIIEDAQANREWSGLNPFDLVDRLKTVRPVHPTLTRRQTTLVLPQLRQDVRRLVKTMVLVGLRPGEAIGLKKVDVDLDELMLIVRRSHGRGQTKTGKERQFPIPKELVEDLRAAMEESLSEYVFPRADGRRRTRNSRLTGVLRTAMRRAGILSGYRFLCRKYSCPFTERLFRKTDKPTPCPVCREPMWFTGVPKQMRFYDLRHTSSTLHRKAKADPLVIREMMGHGSKNETDATYTHLDSDYQRAELERLSLTPEQD